MMADHLDGHDMLGALAEIFAVDVSTAVAPCTNCRQPNVLAELRVYGGPNAPGLVARCPGCDAVVLRVVRGPDRAWLDLRGLRHVELAVPDPARG